MINNNERQPPGDGNTLYYVAIFVMIVIGIIVAWNFYRSFVTP